MRALNLGHPEFSLRSRDTRGLRKSGIRASWCQRSQTGSKSIQGDAIKPFRYEDQETMVEFNRETGHNAYTGNGELRWSPHAQGMKAKD